MKTYKVSEIFGGVVQGEGFHAGRPCSFLRFAGCNLWPNADVPSVTCPWCDTAQLHSGRDMGEDEIIKAIEYCTSIGAHGLVISGGEPVQQLDEKLLYRLADRFQWVDIETNGTLKLTFELPDNVFVSCSPKTPLINVQVVHWFKVLVPDKLCALPAIETFRKNSGVPVYVQPVEIGGYESAVTKENIAKCVSLCNERGYRLSLQLHKIIGIR